MECQIYILDKSHRTSGVGLSRVNKGYLRQYTLKLPQMCHKWYWWRIGLRNDNGEYGFQKFGTRQDISVQASRGNCLEAFALLHTSSQRSLWRNAINMQYLWFTVKVFWPVLFLCVYVFCIYCMQVVIWYARASLWTGLFLMMKMNNRHRSRGGFTPRAQNPLSRNENAG